MTNTWGNEEESSRDPADNSRIEISCFSIGTVCATLAGLALYLEANANVYVARGAYSLLAAGTVIGAVGWLLSWLLCRGERRIGRRLGREVRQLRSEVAARDQLLADLTMACDRMSEILIEGGGRLPGRPPRAPGQVYHSSAARGGMAGIGRSRVDADTIGALRLDVDPDAARTEGFAQGYAEGVARRLEAGEDPSPN